MLNRLVFASRFVLVGMFAAGCGGNAAVEFPVGLEPLEDNRAAEPSADGTLSYNDGKDLQLAAQIRLPRDIQIVVIDAWRIAQRVDFDLGCTSRLLHIVAVDIQGADAGGSRLHVAVIRHASDSSSTGQCRRGTRHIDRPRQ